ncbi:S-adenosyl-L-methionine-dependent methyltransferase [Didymella exigua CBS 183.55]|uniref:S-adenosyl-L-methionine-dependent methyltransferase n=1 Tax=Didymella exigua CBS 183.55 TaxID=1150837 RepID=A0A6A5RTR7_9PLEO|nr:S-adenosyl-L-methionine-dependent methyltransferase [Didymella exigua CBS 183.55]KAF1931242.1 S-adenosyl-L-methionine-dependent methyltransferase [Didymella exigua CBS 183.55]
MDKPTLSQVVLGLLEPWQFMLVACSYIPSTISHLYTTSSLTSLLSWNAFQGAWFSRFWSWAGPRIREGNGPRITALLEGRVTGAQVVDEVVGEPISGVVLDIGPGLGYWVDLYARTDVPLVSEDDSVRRRYGKGKGITKVYGVEPNAQSHPGLRSRANAAGLEYVYEILPVGIEDIAKKTAVKKGSVDAIVSLLCLCSIPEPEKNIKELHSYLKPGGRWYLYEHVAVKGYWTIQLYQRFVNSFWPHALGGCQLCRDTEKLLREAGSWSKIDIAQPPIEPWHAVVPHIFGTLTK